MLGRPDKALRWYILAFKNNARPYDAYSLADCYTDLVDDTNAAAQYKKGSRALS